MIKKIYYWLHQRTAPPSERGGPSAGYWPARIRQRAIDLCDCRGGKILDVGCGEGLFLKFVRVHLPAARVFGADISFAQLALAKERAIRAQSPPESLVQSDALKLAFKDNSFERVICLNLLINIPADGRLDVLLSELYRVCAPGGRILFDIRNSLNLFVRLKYALAHCYDGTLGRQVLQAYSIYRLQARLKASGLTIVKTVSIGFPAGIFCPVILIEAVKA